MGNSVKMLSVWIGTFMFISLKKSQRLWSRRYSGRFLVITTSGRGIHWTLTCAIPVCCVCFCGEAGGSRVLGESTEWKLRGGWAASAVSDTGEGVRVGQAAPLHRPCAEQSRLGRRELVIPLVLLILLFQIHLTAPEGVQGEAGAATAGCGWGRGIVLSQTYRVTDQCFYLWKTRTWTSYTIWYISFWRRPLSIIQLLNWYTRLIQEVFFSEISCII